MTRFLLKASFVVLIITFLLIPFHVAWALYEVENATATNAPTGLTPQQPPAESLQVEWTKPTMGANDSVIKYVYIWNNSDALLDDTQLNQDTNDGVVLKDDLLKASKNSSDFAGEDYDVSSCWYFHIKTVYFNTTEGKKLGDDLYVGPFNFDDQAPEGTIALDTSVVGQTATTSSVNPVTLALTATPDTETVYLSNTTTQPQTGGVAFANTLTHTVTDGVGEKNIYIWFEDQAGNTSSFYTRIFDIIAGKSMDPAEDLPLKVNETQQFQIQGAGDETYVWSIVDPDTGETTTVATFDGAFTGVNKVNVVAAQEGSFNVQATPDEGVTVYESGTITVVMSVLYGDVSGNETINAYDASLAAQYGVGLITLDADEVIAADVSGNGTVNAYDASLIAQKGVGLIDTFPVEQ